MALNLSRRLTVAIQSMQKNGVKIVPRLMASYAKPADSTKEEKIYRENWEQRCNLATAYRACAMYGLNEGICNHLTAKAPSLRQEEAIILIVPYGLCWADVTPASLVGISQKDAGLVEGVDQPDITAHAIHRGIYRHRPDVNSVMHTHSVYATTLSVLEDPELKMVHQNCLRFKDRIAYDLEYGGMSDDEVNDESDRLGQAVGDKEIMMMANHGIATVGRTVAMAFEQAYYFEQAAKVLIKAYQTGKTLRYLGPQTIKEFQEYFPSVEEDNATMHLAALKKSLFKPTLL